MNNTNSSYPVNLNTNDPIPSIGENKSVNKKKEIELRNGKFLIFFYKIYNYYKI